MESGNYPGLVSVTKRLHLVGVDTGEGRPVVDAGGKGSPIALLVQGSSIEGFEVRNSGLSELEAGIKVSSGNMTVRDNRISKCNLGIRLQISDGSTVERNELSDNQRGIILFQSNGNKVQNNILGSNVYGILAWDSWGNTISNNEIWNSQEMGIYLVSSQENYLTGNKLGSNSIGLSLAISPANVILNNVFYGSIERGIYFKRSGGNVLKNNQMEANARSIYLEGQDYSDFNNDVDVSNLVDKKPIYYLVDSRDAVVNSSSRAGEVICIRCSNITVKDLVTEGSEVGVYLFQTRDSLIENVTSRNNEMYGIELVESYNNLITLNSVSHNNKSGIYIEGSGLNVVKGNNAFNNTIGINLDDTSSNNAMYLNNLVYNGDYNALDEGTNFWNVSWWGNFYDDFNCTDVNGDSICDSMRTISGGKGLDGTPLAGIISREGQRQAPTIQLDMVEDSGSESGSQGAQASTMNEEDQGSSCPLGETCY